MRITLVCLALPAFAFVALAAPVPFPREVADVVVRIESKGKYKTLVDRLRSRDFAAAVLKSEKARNLRSVRGNADAAAWLAARMKVTPVREGEALRISLENCPAKESLELLSAVLEAGLNEIMPSRTTLQQRLALYRERLATRERQGRGGNAIIDCYGRTILRYQQQLQKMDEGLILQKPRLLKGNR